MDTEPQPKLSSSDSTPRWRRIFPFVAAALAVLAPLVVGVLTPEPMIGDEVTHFYMLTTQAEKLPAGNVEAEIPLAYGGFHKRNYPHVFLWHYLGAIVWKAAGEAFAAVQFYHILYWLQFLVAAWFLARAEAPARRDAATVFLMAVASIPMNLLFAVAFYQDVPASAQVLSAFAALRGGHWLLSVAFMALAISLKISAMSMIPVYLCVLAWFAVPAGWKVALLRPTVAGLLLAAACVPSAMALQSIGWAYYPAMQLEFLVRRAGFDWRPGTGRVDTQQETKVENGEQKKERRRFRAPVNLAKAEEAYHPGDLRRPVNVLIYGGPIALGLTAAGLLLAVESCIRRRRRNSPCAPTPGQETGGTPPTGPPGGRGAPESGTWALIAGLAAALITLIQVRAAPDIRFLMPAMPLMLLPGALRLGELSGRFRWAIPVFAACAFMQGGVVLAKAYELRHIPSGITEAIAYLKANPPNPPRIFMYPEGHYRFFPVVHDWYLGNRLQEFWSSDNDGRLAILRERKIGAMAVKTARIGKLDKQAGNLGIYPDTFLRDINGDRRFRKVLQNSDVILYRVAEAGETEAAP